MSNLDNIFTGVHSILQIPACWQYIEPCLKIKSSKTMAECGVMGDCLYSMCKALGSISSMKEGGEKLTRVLSSKINNYCPVIIGTFNLIDCMV